MAAPRRSWPRRLVAALVLLALAAWAAPPLIARSPLVGWAARAALADLRGSVRVGSASLGWFSRPVLRDLELADPDGKPVATVAEVELSRPLIGLALDRSDLGTVAVRGAELHLAFAGGVSNLERTLPAAWLEPAAPPPGRKQGADAPRSPRPALAVECTDAHVNISDDDAGRSWAYDIATATAALPAAGPVKVTARGALAKEPARTFAADLTATLAPALSVEGTLAANDLPLDPAVVALRRLDPRAVVAGRLTADLAGCWAAGGDATLAGNVRAAGLRLSGAPFGPDAVALASVTAPCRLTARGGAVTVERLAVTCDVGTAELAGTFDPATGPAGLIDRPGVTARADVDLAKLAALLPKTLGLRKGVAVTSGRLVAGARSAASPAGVVWSGEVRADDIAAVHDGKPVAWKKPLSAAFAARRGPDGWPAVDRLTCESDFLKVTARGDASKLDATADADLAVLAEQLGRFVDLGPARLAGKGTARLAAARGPAGAFTVRAEATVRDLAAAGPGGRWQDPALSGKLDAAGRQVAAGTWALNTAVASLAFGPDTAEAALTARVPDVAAASAGSARVKAAGDLARWHRRLVTFVPALAAYAATGTGEASADVRFDRGVLVTDNLALDLRDLRTRALGLNVAEPVVTVRGKASLRLADGALTLPEATVASPTVAARAEGVSATTGPAGVKVAGRGSVRADLTRLRAALGDAAAGLPPLAGAAAGWWEVGGAAGRPALASDLDVASVTVGPPAAPLWKEDKARLTLRAAFDGPDSVKIDDASVAGSGATVKAAGAVTRLSAGGELAVKGTLVYDLERLEPQLKAYVGGGVKAAGRGSREFTLTGPLSDPLGKLVGDADLDWQSVRALGCVAGPGKLHAHMANGVLELGPAEGTVNQGKMRLTPSLRLAPGPMAAVLGPGSVDRAKLTPAMFADALGYAAPLLAKATQADGEISLQLDGGKVPLDNPLAADVAGRLVMHSGRIAASPTLMELARVFRANPVVTVPKDAVVPFRVMNGRVFHDNFVMEFAGVRMKSFGSVGLDGTLNVVVEMPVPPSWVGNNPLGRALEKQTVRLVIGGTAERPVIDEKGLRDLVKGVARDGAADVLQKEIEGGLKKLLQRK